MERNWIYTILVCGWIMILFHGCIPEEKVEYDGVDLDFRSSLYKSVYDHQVAQQIDSLLQFTSHEDPTVRYLVARAFSSYQNGEALDSLYKLLNDPDQKVSSAAAYSLGQIKDGRAVNSLLQSFKAQDTSRIYNDHNATVLEAVGKLADSTLLNSIATVSSYGVHDTTLLLGQTRAIYQAALRGILTDDMKKNVLDKVTEVKYPESVRTIAANVLLRNPDVDITGYEQRLWAVYTDAAPEIRMALAPVISKITDAEIRKGYVASLATESDYRVLVNMIRSLKDMPYIDVIEPVIDLLKHKNEHVALEAAQYMIDNGIASDAIIYKNFIPKDATPKVKYKVKSAILKHLPNYYIRSKDLVKKELLDSLNRTDDAYQKVAIMDALSYDARNYKSIIGLYDVKDPVVASSAMTALKNIVESDGFLKSYGRNKRVKREIIDSLKVFLEKGDAGANAVIGTILSKEDNVFKGEIEDPSFLKLAMQKAKLPQEIETYNELNKAVAYLTDSQYVPKILSQAKQIDWKLLNSYGDTIYAIIKTGKGSIKLKLFPDLAPHSVANFIELSNSQFYDNRYVHRVVPNFVIQDGCPRGDGYGSLDYSIRTEVPQIYYEDAGYIGMASAGLHTEGTQWFITHSPTMHLNGRYTIFGKVTEGMDTVHDIQVGDKIIDISILKNN